MKRMWPLARLLGGGTFLVVHEVTATERDTAEEAPYENMLLDDPGDARDTASTWYRRHAHPLDPKARSTPTQNAAFRDANRVPDTGDARRQPLIPAD